MRKQSVISLGIVLVAVSGALAKKEPAIPTTATNPKQVALVRVNVTGQGYDYFRPWQKKAPFSKRALGAVLPKGRVLVTADLVTNQNYVELERAESGEKTAANVRVIDYEANLALLEPTDKKFLDGLSPLELATDTTVGDRLAAWPRSPLVEHAQQTASAIPTPRHNRRPSITGRERGARQSWPNERQDGAPPPTSSTPRARGGHYQEGQPTCPRRWLTTPWRPWNPAA